MILENFVKFCSMNTAFSSGLRATSAGLSFCYFTCFVGIAMAEERDITIRQNSIASIFDEILAVSLLEIFSVREVVITKFECI